MRILMFALLVGLTAAANAQATYPGKPPAHLRPGKCWCMFHGPHGGCVRWECRRR